MKVRKNYFGNEVVERIFRTKMKQKRDLHFGNLVFILVSSSIFSDAKMKISNYY